MLGRHFAGAKSAPCLGGWHRASRVIGSRVAKRQRARLAPGPGARLAVVAWPWRHRPVVAVIPPAPSCHGRWVGIYAETAEEPPKDFEAPRLIGDRIGPQKTGAWAVRDRWGRRCFGAGLADLEAPGRPWKARDQGHWAKTQHVRALTLADLGVEAAGHPAAQPRPNLRTGA